MNTVNNNDTEPQPPVAAVDSIDAVRAENETLKNLIRIRGAQDQLTESLKAAGARSPGLLFAYAVDDLQMDDNGRLQNRAALVERMKREFPEQFGRDAAAGSIDAGTRGPGPALSKEALARMTPAEIAKLDWQDVRRVLSGG